MFILNHFFCHPPAAKELDQLSYNVRNFVAQLEHKKVACQQLRLLWKQWIPWLPRVAKFAKSDPLLVVARVSLKRISDLIILLIK